MEVLHSNASLFTIRFGNHCFDQACEDVHVVILSSKYTQSIFDTRGSLGILTVIST